MTETTASTMADLPLATAKERALQPRLSVAVTTLASWMRKQRSAETAVF